MVPMKSRVALLVLMVVACSDTQTGERVGTVRQSLEYAPELNQFSTAIGTRAFPNAEGAFDPLAWRVVSSEAFDQALGEFTNKSSTPLEESKHFLDGAQVSL